MKNIALALAFVFLLAGCVTDGIVNRNTGPSWEETRIVQCQYAGYCHGYYWNPRLERYMWSYGYSYNCNGHQKVDVRVTPVEITRESGLISEYNREEVIRFRSVCR